MPRGTKQLVLKEKAQPARANPRRKATDNPKRAVATRGRKKMEEPAVHNTKRKRNAGESSEVTNSSVPQPKRAKEGNPEVTSNPAVKEPKPSSSRSRGSSKSRTTDVKKTSSKVDTEPSSQGNVIISHHSHRKEPGEVMVMGQGDTGQLGLGEEIMEKKKPFLVGGVLNGLRVVQVACGGMHTAVLTDNGKVLTWGCNDEGALGRAVEDGGEYSPGHVTGLEGIVVVQISAGDSHTAALTQNGDVYCWGVFRDSNGPFGLRTGSPSPEPHKVYSSTSNQAIKIASGNDHIVILTINSDILTLGCAEQGQLGRVPEMFSLRGGRKGTQLLLEPQVIRFRKLKNSPKPKFSDVFCGSYHTFALTEDEAIYTWGLNNYGQLGTNDTESCFQPKRLPKEWIKDDITDSIKENRKDKVSSAKGYHNLDISGGQHHTVLCNKGNVYVMGRKEYGRLGLGKNVSEEPTTPRRVPELSKVVSVTTGISCSFATNESGEIFSWGMGTTMQLGTGEEEDVWTPVKITGKKVESRRVIGASAGGQHTALLVSLPQQNGK